MNARRTVTALCLGAALLMGLVTGVVDLHSEEVQPSLALILVTTFTFGLIRPAHAWLFALISGGSIPVAHVYASLAGFPVPYPVDPGSPLLALIPAFVGAYAAVLLRKVVAATRRSG